MSYESNDKLLAQFDYFRSVFLLPKDMLIDMVKRQYEFMEADELTFQQLMEFIEERISGDRQSLRLLRRVTRAYGIKYDILAIGDVEEILEEAGIKEEEE